MPKNLRYSEHAITRMAQRNLSRQDIEYVYEHGQRIWSGGVQHRFLRHNDIPDGDRKRKHRLEGTVILLDKSGKTVITAYRNRRGLKNIRQKQKWQQPPCHQRGEVQIQS